MQAGLLRSRHIVDGQGLVGADEPDAGKGRRRRQGVGRQLVIVSKQRGQGFLGGEILHQRRAKETLAERALRIGIDQEHSVAGLGEVASQMKTRGTLPQPPSG